jgi:nucleoid-associated protein YgaU
VTRGESLWSIAQDHLGDGARYPEIADLNTDALGGRPAFLLPGTVLTLPATDPAGAPGEGTYTVRKGDTLSGIADKKLGDAGRYPEIFDASRNITQPGGRHLSDPDVIDIGWTLAIPEPHATTATTPVAAPKPPGRGRTPSRLRPGPPPHRRPHGTARAGRRPRRRTPAIVRVTSLGRA